MDKPQSSPAWEPAISYDMNFLSAYGAPDADPDSLRDRYCFLCQTTVGQVDEDRLRICRERRCGLREAGEYDQERRWSMVAIVETMSAFDSAPPPQDVLDAINERVIRAGSLAVVLVPMSDGSTGWDLVAGTLRGQVHKALLRFHTIIGGHPLLPGLTDLDAEGLRRYRRQRQIARVQVMADFGMSQLAIERATNIPRSTIQHWLKLPRTAEGGVPKSAEMGTPHALNP